jgi:L-alanine-DL-glutamate epimerase-like enolase superfamily enzyme
MARPGHQAILRKEIPAGSRRGQKGIAATKIAKLKTRLIELPYRKPLITATNRFSKAQGLLVEAVSDDGLSGFGYADLFPRTGETAGSAVYAVEKLIAPAVEKRNIAEIAKIKSEINHLLIGNSRVKSAVDSALYDLLARRLKAPLYLMFGGAVKKQVRIIRFVGLAAPEVMAEDARQLVARGFTALKLKISGDWKLDTARVAAVRQAAGDDVFIKVDANEAYETKAALRLANKLADFDVAILEQPVPRAQIQALKEIKLKSPIQIEGDQSANTVAEAYRLIEQGAVDSINTSAQKAGGFAEARRIAELCSTGGVACHLSNTAGCMIGDAAALHLATSCAGISSLCELGEFETIDSDPFQGLTVKDGAVSLSEEPGLGVVPR